MLVMLKYWQFKDSESDKTKLNKSKCWRFNDYNNEERNGLNDDEGAIEDARYVFFPFIPLFFFS